MTLLYLDRQEEAQQCFDEAARLSKEFADKIQSGAFSTDTPRGPDLPEALFGPYIEENPEFDLYEKQENFVRKEYVIELFNV